MDGIDALEFFIIAFGLGIFTGVVYRVFRQVFNL